MNIKFYSRIVNIFRTIFRKIKNVVFVFKQKINYRLWIKRNEPNQKELDKQRETKFRIEPKISIIVPMFNTPYKFFKELIECLINQTYSNWELCLADGSKKQNEKLQTLIQSDKRIKYKFLNDNKGIAGNTNECIKMATGDYIALFDHDDLLPEFALYEVVKAINKNPNVEFIYTDEDKISSNSKKRFEPYFKPNFAIDTLRSGNYICHFSVFKKEIMDKLEGERSEYDGAQDFDLILRMTEVVKPQNIVHIPKILYHWRISKTSTASNSESKPYAYITGEKAVQDHLDRLKIDAIVKRSKYYGVYETIYTIKQKPKVNILIPSTDDIEKLKNCINSILEKTTYDNFEIVIIENNSKLKETFNYYKEIEKEPKIKVLYYSKNDNNYSKIINFGVKSTDGKYILQLSQNTEIIEPEWLNLMLGICQRDDVGVVGAKILFPDKTIEHAGIVLGMTAAYGRVHKGLEDSDFGYFSRNLVRQNVTAVESTCLLSKREIYEDVNYLDENLANFFNDIDFCLKAKNKGYLVVYEPNAKICIYQNKPIQKDKDFEDEENLFKKIWNKELEKGDFYFNRNLKLDSNNCEIRTEKESEKE